MRNFCIPFYSLIILLGVSWGSCNKNPSLGLGTQPAKDLLAANFIDTTTVLSYVLRGDSQKTNESQLVMLGSYVDPIFGKTGCSIVTQLNLAGDATNLDFTGGIGTNAYSDLKLDSAVLTLQYMATPSDARKLYGAYDPQTIKVFPINSNYTLTPDSPYYSGRYIPVDSLHPICTQNIIPNPDSNITLGGYYYPSPGLVCPAHLRLRIDSGFASKILHANATALASSANFHAFMPGIVIAPSNVNQPNGQGGIFYFDPHGTFTKFTLYYRREASKPAYGDTLSYSFEINATSAYFNQYTHNYNGTPVGNIITNASPKTIATTLPAHTTDNIYVQAAGGVKPYILLPYLKNWSNLGTIVVNQAQLVVKVDPSTITTSYNPNAMIYLTAVDSTYLNPYYPVDVFDPNSMYSGTFNALTNEYTFNITRHMQAILAGTRKNYGFYLQAGNPTSNAQRVAMYGTSKTPNKIRFRLAYTKIAH